MEQRELKFRAWHPDFGEMVYADMNNIIYEKREFMMQFDVGFSNYPESGWNIMQFTGLVDKAGEPIYEDDIVETADGDKRKIVYVDTGFEMRTFDGNRANGYTWHFGVTKIGNIHQNPEHLIK